MSDAPTTTQRRFIGESISRVDGRAKVTGQADYTADYNLAGQAWAFAVKSRRRGAWWRSIRTTTARRCRRRNGRAAA
jgi:CO/xanthine dehydrogenase Mo-binding subunit